ncbi:MAG TPA: hypothetical protein VFV66_16510 [Nonomuraea sp.]|nr:hypothetical protein [Nonomuraea sp.]
MPARVIIQPCPVTSPAGRVTPRQPTTGVRGVGRPVTVGEPHRRLVLGEVRRRPVLLGAACPRPPAPPEPERRPPPLATVRQRPTAVMGAGGRRSTLPSTRRRPTGTGTGPGPRTGRMPTTLVLR